MSEGVKIKHVRVVDRVATYDSDDGFIVCGNKDYKIEFIFDAEWDAFVDKVARFVWTDSKKKKKSIKVGFKGTQCPVPIMVDTGCVRVGVFVEDYISTSTSAAIQCRRSALCEEATDIVDEDIAKELGYIVKGEKGDPYTLTDEDRDTIAEEVAKDSVPKMYLIDQRRVDAYKEVGGYYFSENNWKAFIGDEASGKFGYNRAYVSRSKNRGDYGMYALSYSSNPIYNAWYSKSEWATRFAKEHPDEEFREPYDNEYPLLDSIVQRLANGHIVVPLNPTDNSHAVSLAYIIQLREKFNANIKELEEDFNTTIDELNDEFNSVITEIRNDVYAGTEGLAYELSADGTHYISVGLGDVPENSDIEIAGYYEGLPVTEVASGAFNGKAHASVKIPTTITKFNYTAFGWASKTNKVYIKDIAKWCEITFEGSSSPVTASYPKIYIKGIYKEHLEIPEGVTSIPQRCFMHWKQFKSVTLPQTLTTIKSMGFQYCSGLESVTIPSSVRSIEASAFGYCSGLKTVTFEGKPSGTITARAFEYCPNLTDIFVPWGRDGVANAPWGAVNANIHYPKLYSEGLAYELSASGTECICVGIGTSTDTDIIIAREVNGLPVTKIRTNAFFGGRITSVIIPDSITSIGQGAFCLCNSLTSITVNEENTSYCSIDGNLYSKDRKNLIQYANGKEDSHFVIPDSVTSIGNEAFRGCNNLTSVTIGNSVTSIDNMAFAYCENLTSITIPDSVTTVSFSAFGFCKNLTIAKLGRGITKIGDGAYAVFSGCTALELIKAPTGLIGSPWGTPNKNVVIEWY